MSASPFQLDKQEAHLTTLKTQVTLMAAGLLMVVVFYFVIGIPIGAVVLRGAVSLANKILGPPKADSQRLPEDSIEMPAGSSDPSNPYSAPQVTSVAGYRQDTVIPEPSFGSAYLMVLAQLILGVVVGFVIGLAIGAALGAEASWLASVLSLVVGVGINAVVLSSMLPTTFKRGMLVSFMQILIGLLIAAVIIGVAMGVGFMA